MVKISSRYLHYSFKGEYEDILNKIKKYVYEFLGENQLSKSKLYILKDEKNNNKLIVKCNTKYSEIIIAAIAIKTKEENLKLLKIAGTIKSLIK